MKILLVEDDPFVGESLTAMLTDHHYTVDQAVDGQIGLELASLWGYDLILLDIEVPRLDGIQVCHQLRAQGCTTPILMLTVHNSNARIVQGLDAGADDYLVKPYEATQLLARIRALLRRGGSITPSMNLTWGSLCLNPTAAQVTYNDQPLGLTSKEYSLLELFLRYPQRIFNRDAIIDRLWPIDQPPSDKAVTNLVKDLRRKLKAGGLTEELLDTVYGIGYRLRPEPKNALPELRQGSPPPAESAPLTQKEQWQAGVRRLVERFRASLGQRVAVLEDAIQLLQSRSLSDECRQIAKAEAHRLAGGLGTFGYERGSTLAREIEQRLANIPLDAESIAQLSQLLLDLKQVLMQPPSALSIAPDVEPQPAVVLLIDVDALFTQAIEDAAVQQKLPIAVACDWAVASHYCAMHTPSLILLNPVMLKESDGLTQWQQLRARCADAQLLALVEHDCLADRLMAAKIGSDRCITKSTAIAEVLDTISQCMARPQTLSARLLAVDDDESILATLVHLLEPWGIQVTSLSDPSQFWDFLTAVDPDMVVLDLEMPEFKGIELCQIVRQDARYSDLPILMVTAHTDSASLQEVFASGADDLISKPIVGPELVSRVLSRLERARLRHRLNHLQQQSQKWQQFVNLDPITQIVNGRAFDYFLSQGWQRALQQQQPLSLIFCNVDYFDRYCKCYGEQASNDCLRHVAHTIQRCIKPFEDQVAKVEAAKFAITLPNTSLTGALQVAERIQRAIAALTILHQDSPISTQVTLSLGITGTHPTAEKTMETLVEIAHQELALANERGGNTFCLSPYS